MVRFGSFVGENYYQPPLITTESEDRGAVFEKTPLLLKKVVAHPLEKKNTKIKVDMLHEQSPTNADSSMNESPTTHGQYKLDTDQSVQVEE